MKRMILAGTALMFLSAPAFADCAETIVEIENALETSAIGDADKATVASLIDQAKAEAGAGNEDACVAVTDQAKAILGI